MRALAVIFACILVPVLPGPPAKNEIPKIAMESNWGWSDKVWLDEDGELTCDPSNQRAVESDRIYEVKK